jgi:hypothetical protein
MIYIHVVQAVDFKNCCTTFKVGFCTLFPDAYFPLMPGTVYFLIAARIPEQSWIQGYAEKGL